MHLAGLDVIVLINEFNAGSHALNDNLLLFGICREETSKLGRPDHLILLVGPVVFRST